MPVMELKGLDMTNHRETNFLVCIIVIIDKPQRNKFPGMYYCNY